MGVDSKFFSAESIYSEGVTTEVVLSINLISLFAQLLDD